MAGEIPMTLLWRRHATRLEILCRRPPICGRQGGPMLDLIFLGGGVLLLVLLIAYARLTNRI
jgi:hypothetical protein